MDDKKLIERDFWKKEEEKLLKEWADKAQCYYWMHLRAHRAYKKRYTLFTIPVIVISTITGTANFAQGMFGDYQTMATIIIGSMNILAGIITTIYQFLKVAELNEGHRAAALSWAKFFEYIKLELAKNPLDREKPSKVLKYCAQQYDHLIEFSPIIPQAIINDFKTTFKKFKDIIVPTIVGRLRGTHIFDENLLILPIQKSSEENTSNEKDEDFYATDMPVNVMVLAKSPPPSVASTSVSTSVSTSSEEDKKSSGTNFEAEV
jgi:hypothetical protein